MGLFKPDISLDNITLLTNELLKDIGVRGIILDVDNTLVAFKSKQLDELYLQWINDRKKENYKLVIVSNNTGERVSHIAKMIDIPFISMGLKPLPFGLKRAVKMLGLPKNQILVVGDQIYTDVLGAHLTGLKVALMKPLSQNDSFVTKFFRKLERPLRKRYSKDKEGKL